MLRILQTELWKLKRYHIIWSGIFLMLLSVLVTLFYSTAVDGTVWTYPFFAEQVIKNNTTMIFPMCIALIAGYIIAREEKDDTLKSILTVPVSYRCLLFGKLAACALLSLVFGLASVLFTIAANLAAGFPGLTLGAALQTLAQIPLNCLFLYFAVMPVIAAGVHIPNGHMIGTIVAFAYGYGGLFAAGRQWLANLYPIMASLGLIGYRSYDPAVHWNVFLCACSLLAASLITAAFVMTAKQGEPAKAPQKTKKTAPKKGW